MKYQYPSCKTVDTVENWFGHELADPYSWLRNAKDPEVLDFVARENAFTDAFFPADQLQEMIDTLKANRLKDLPMTMTPWGDGYLGTILEDGRPKLCILDRNFSVSGELSKVEELGNVMRSHAVPCPKNEDILAMMIQYPGAARPSLVIYAVSTGKVLTVIHSLFSFCWSAGDGCVYYSSTQSDPKTQQSHSVFYRFDPATQQEAVVYEDDTCCIFGQVHASKDGRYVLATICQDYSHAYWAAIDTATGDAEVLTDKVEDWTYLDSIDGKHYFITMTASANGAVIAVTGKERTVVLPESNRILGGGFSVNGKLFLTAMEDVSSRLIRLEDNTDVALPSRYGAVGVTGEARNGVFLRFESFTDAPAILLFDGKEMTPVLSAADAHHPDLVVEQGFAPSTEDGTKIPYYLVRHKDTPKDGNAPTLIYAYGGYNNSILPQYVERVSGTQIARWAEEGGIYVQCNLRGGSEYGPAWHEGGMKMTKRHCYEDFIGVAEEVIRNGWTGPGKLAISGCSNGGLLMSALVTMRPDLWACVLDSVPHTDMIHFVEDDRGPMYITEYGNPRESKEMFEYLLSYSPYHNVKPVNYPWVYVQTGELDNNVPPYHGKKFAARMQAENRSNNPILLRVLAEGSHDRGKGEVFWHTTAEMQLFMKYALNK